MKRRFFDGGREVVSDGALCHGVLRGFSDSSGIMCPNNDGASVGEFARILKENKLNKFIMMIAVTQTAVKIICVRLKTRLTPLKILCAVVLCWKVISKRDAARAAFSVVREQTPVSAGLRRRSFCLNCTVYCNFTARLKNLRRFLSPDAKNYLYLLHSQA